MGNCFFPYTTNIKRLPLFYITRPIYIVRQNVWKQEGNGQTENRWKAGTIWKNKQVIIMLKISHNLNFPIPQPEREIQAIVFNMKQVELSSVRLTHKKDMHTITFCCGASQEWETTEVRILFQLGPIRFHNQFSVPGKFRAYGKHKLRQCLRACPQSLWRITG